MRRRSASEALGDEAGDGRRHLRPQEDHLVILVEELIGGVPQAVFFDHLRVLQRRGDDLPEPEQLEAVPDLGLHLEQTRGLWRQHVARSRRCGEFPRRLAVHRRGYLNRWKRL